MGSVAKSVTLVPSGYTGNTGLTLSTNASYKVANGYKAANDTSSSARLTCQTSTTGYLYYTFDTSDIPSNATITSITGSVTVRVSNTTRVTSTKCQLFTGTTEKGSNVTFASTTAGNTVTLSAGSNWTRTELNDFRLKIGATGSSSTSSKYIYFYGASVTVNYTVPAFDVTISNSTSATVTVDNATPMTGESVEVRSDTLSGITVKDNGVDVTSQFVQRSETAESYTVVNTGNYGFNLNSSTGYYVSNNKGVSKTAALCRVDFHVPVAATITFSYINYAEQGYDFGVFGNIDVALSDDYYAAGSSGATITDSSYKRACNTSSYNSSSVQTLTYDMSAGDHSIWVKYSKDDASDANNDTLQFKVSITLNEPFTPGTYYGYDINNITADHVIVVTSGGTTALYVKQNGAWVQVSRAYKKTNGTWTQVAVDQAFQSGVKYVKG